MKLSDSQKSRFWREWASAIAHHNWPRDRSELERKALLARAGFASLKDVDRTQGFDRVLAEIGLLVDDVDRTAETIPGRLLRLPTGCGTWRVHDSPGLRRNFLWNIRKHALDLGGEPYALQVARDRFRITEGLTTLEDLKTEDLFQLMITLDARLRSKTARDLEASLLSEEQFPDDIDFPADPGLEEESTEPHEPVHAHEPESENVPF